MLWPRHFSCGIFYLLLFIFFFCFAHHQQKVHCLPHCSDFPEGWISPAAEGKWGPWFVRSYHAVRSETGRSAGAAAPAGMSQREKSKSWKWEKKACAWRKRSSRSPPLNTLHVLPHKDLWYKGFDTSFQGLLQEIGVSVEMETSAGASLKRQTMSFRILCLCLWQAAWLFGSLLTWRDFKVDILEGVFM